LPQPADARMRVPRTDTLGHPLDATGLPVRQLTLLGVPTEGLRYFNHYLPSPKSRSRVFDSIQSALDAMWVRLAPILAESGQATDVPAFERGS
ncbi:MAG TPA: hypothetical protein VN280_11795, partial [Variovorax sp.]|nr:hypothetical protein [Variovorax sp.]